MLRSLIFFTGLSLIFCLSGCAHVPSEKQSIWVQGEVRRPGKYYIDKKLAYIVVIMGARGYTMNADPTKVIIDRKSKSFMLDLSTSKKRPGPHLAETFLIQPGDRITVPKKKQ